MSGKIALVIGNGAYAHASALVNPANDARDIAAALTRIGFCGVSVDTASIDTNKNVAPLIDLDYSGLRRALAAFARAADDADQAILYYAGHGIEVSGQNYLIPVDARLAHVRDVEFETLSMMQLLNAVGGEGASGLRLIILDACRDNPFRGRLFATRDLGRGLRAVEPGRNILVAYAAKHGTVAWDGIGSNSPFASALLQHIETPGLEIMDMFREIKDAVLEATGNRQEPYLYGSLGRRRDYLVLSNPQVPDQIAVTPQAEDLNWSVQQNQHYFDPQIPATFRFLSESVRDPLGAVKVVIYGAIKGIEAIAGFLGQLALDIAKKGARSIETHASNAIAAVLFVLLFGGVMSIFGALPRGWEWLKPLLAALGVVG